MGYKVIVTYTRPNESGASLMGAGFIMNQWKVQHDGEGTITEGLVRWICIDGRQPDVEDREFARRGLDRMKELSGAL